MESREEAAHIHQRHHQMIPSYSFSPNNNSNNRIPNPNSGFPFNSVSPPQRRPSSAADGGLEVSSPSRTGQSTDPERKKRGRPRKYTPDGGIGLALSPSGGATPGDPSARRNRGRPPSSGKKQLDALGGVGGIGFTPHVIKVNVGEDIASKIMEFSQQGPRSVCILSANGAIRNVSLRQSAMSGATVSYEGHFEIISLSGSYSTSEDNSSCKPSGNLSISLGGSDGRVVGGGVSGLLVAASTVQVIVGSFVADGKKSSSKISNLGPSSWPGTQMLNFDAPLAESSPPSQGASSESSDENGGSPPTNRTPGIYGNSGQPIHNMPMYLWAGPNP